ncbi:MAG: hypothetical protein ACPIOQ_01670 [Promethearchaeia archaeon]
MSCQERPGISIPLWIAVMANVMARAHLAHAHTEQQAQKPAHRGPKFHFVQDQIQRQRSESGNRGNALLASDLHLVLWSACLDGGLLGSPDAFFGFADKDDSGIVSLAEFSLAVQASVGQQVLGTEWESIPEASLHGMRCGSFRRVENLQQSTASKLAREMGPHLTNYKCLLVSCSVVGTTLSSPAITYIAAITQKEENKSHALT